MSVMPRAEAFDAVSTEAASAGPTASVWAGFSTRTRLILVVLAIDLIAAIVSCGAVVLNARSAVKVEMSAARATVEPLVADTIRMARSPTPESLLHTLDLRFQALRHVRVAVLDAQGNRIGFPLPDRRRDASRAPAWFVALIRPAPEQHELPIAVDGTRIGTALITDEPHDEIDEVWGYGVSLSLASLALNLAVLAALYLAFGRLLKPLGGLAEGMTQLEHHDYTARLESPASRELAAIARRFNSLAAALGEARAANGRLNRQLLTAQDDEGRRIALELHDEFGPCLFALEANAASINRIAEGAADPDRAKLAARAGEIGGIVAQVQARNRELLNRLRPHALGQVPLADCLNLLLQDFSRRHPGTEFAGAFGTLARSYGDLVDLTVFRCVQESMTNAVRHGGARHVRVEIGEAGAPADPPAVAPISAVAAAQLLIAVRDDGRGIAPDHGTGLGLSGMRERVEALDGTFALDNGCPGAVVRITIPIESQGGEDGAEDPATSPVPSSSSP